MKKTTTLILTILVGLFFSQANANVIGTEYQNFNPTYSGLDFTTVQSSETLKPCLCNIGLFFNYAKNTLTYSDSYYSSAGSIDLKGQRSKDFLLGADLNVGFGIMKFWDIGVSFPFVVTAKNDDPYGVSYFDKFGLTEVRPATKLRFYGDDEGGLAVMLSGNFNVIDNNPFSGQTPGATVNLELIGDTTTESGTKWGFNIGYRKRNPGTPIDYPITGDRPPFVPFKDSWIASVAMATGIESLNSDFVGEVIGSHSGKLNESDTSRAAQQALEVNLGLRHDWNKSLNLHGGLGTKLANAQASPDIRAYIGLNMNFGPVCGSTPSRSSEYPVAVVDNTPLGTNGQTSLSMPVTAKNIEAYRYKIGSTPNMNCSEESAYSEEIAGTTSIDTDITDIPDGGVTLCALAKNTRGVWQPLSEPSIYTWIKSKGKADLAPSAPVAVVSNHPVGDSDQTDLDMPISAVDAMDYQAYRWKIGSTPRMKCEDPTGYSDEIPGSQSAVTSVKDIPDGGITMCTVAKNNGGVWQSFNQPTVVRWNKVSSNSNVVQKNGYEVFKLSAEVLFDFNKDNIRAGAQPELDKIDRYLKQKPYRKVIIEGHTDSKGSDAYNMNLSRRRAVQVKRWMIDKYGVQGSKFTPSGKGETVPVDTNETDEGRQNNRRVEFKIYR